MKIIGAIQGDVQGDFFHSLGDHEEDQHHAPADFDYDDAIGRIQAAEAGLQQVPTNTLAVAQNQVDIDANETSIEENENSIAANVAAIEENENNITGLATDLGVIQEFFEEDAQGALTGNIAHETNNEVVIENLRAVESAQGTDPEDGGPRGFLLTTGYCTEKLELIDDGRVSATFKADDPAESDDSKLYWTYRFGAKDGETGADRHEHDGLLLEHGREDASGAVRPFVQQTDLQQVELSCSKDKPNLKILARTKNNDSSIVEIIKDENNFLKMTSEGTVQAGQFEADVMYMKDGLGDERAVMDSDALLFFNTDPNAQYDNWAFKFGPNGPEPAASAPVAGDPSRTHASQMGSAVHDPVVQLHKLKANHIPVYLQANVTANDLPTGHGLDCPFALEQRRFGRARRVPLRQRRLGRRGCTGTHAHCGL